MRGQPVLDRTLSLVSAVLVPLFALLVHHHELAAQDAEDIGAVWAAAVGSFHAGTAVQRARARTAPSTTAAAAERPAAPLTPIPGDFPTDGGTRGH